MPMKPAPEGALVSTDSVIDTVSAPPEPKTPKAADVQEEDNPFSAEDTAETPKPKKKLKIQEPPLPPAEFTRNELAEAMLDALKAKLREQEALPRWPIVGGALNLIPYLVRQGWRDWTRGKI